jgi:hypothetical protein
MRRHVVASHRCVSLLMLATKVSVTTANGWLQQHSATYTDGGMGVALSTRATAGADVSDSALYCFHVLMVPASESRNILMPRKS